MKSIKLLVCLLLIIGYTNEGFAQTKKADPSKQSQVSKSQVVEAACGQCQFHMKGKGCSLAVRINGKSYFVDGFSIDSFGDAHAMDGFCEAIRKAEVKGTVVNNRFKATAFKILPDK